MTATELYLYGVSIGLENNHTSISFGEIESIYNGVGAEWMPEKLRKVLDKLSETLLPAVLVHDFDYYFGDGTLLDFQLANNRLYANGRKCADAKFAWYHPKRYLVRRQARAYSRLCNLFGLPAYLHAVEARKKGNA